jgi:AcrR family transcriptional regulator
MAGSKKRDECSEEARTRILDAAQTLFAAHGFNATTTKAIAEQAGVPGGLIFYYFPTKKALLASVLSERNILVELRTVVDTLIIPDPRAALITLASRYLTTLEQHKELACIMLREFQSHPEVAAEFHELHEENIRFIASYVQKTLNAGQYKSVKNVQAIARMFLYNIIVIGIIEDLPDPLHFVENMVDILLPDLVKNPIIDTHPPQTV